MNFDSILAAIALEVRPLAFSIQSALELFVEKTKLSVF